MAMIKCPECGKDISDKASACIGCGCPIEKPSVSDTLTEFSAVEGTLSIVGNLFTFKEFGRERSFTADSITHIDIAHPNFYRVSIVTTNITEPVEFSYYDTDEGKRDALALYEYFKSKFPHLCVTPVSDIPTQSKASQYVQSNNAVRCPKCNSTSLSANKKGFGIGKAVVGAALTGGALGLVAGNIGAKKVRITCLSCGHQWMAGKV